MRQCDVWCRVERPILHLQQPDVVGTDTSLLAGKHRVQTVALVRAHQLLCTAIGTNTNGSARARDIRNHCGPVVRVPLRVETGDGARGRPVDQGAHKGGAGCLLGAINNGSTAIKRGNAEERETSNLPSCVQDQRAPDKRLPLGASAMQRPALHQQLFVRAHV